MGESTVVNQANGIQKSITTVTTKTNNSSNNDDEITVFSSGNNSKSSNSCGCNKADSGKGYMLLLPLNGGQTTQQSVFNGQSSQTVSGYWSPQGDVLAGLPRPNITGELCPNGEPAPLGPLNVPYQATYNNNTQTMSLQSAQQAVQTQQTTAKNTAGVTQMQLCGIQAYQKVYGIELKPIEMEGNVLVCKSDKGKVVKFNPDGTTVEGTAPAAASNKPSEAKTENKDSENKAVAPTNESKKPEVQSEVKPTEAQQTAIDRLSEEHGGSLIFNEDSNPNNKGILVARPKMPELNAEKTIAIYPDGTSVEILKEADKEGFWGWMKCNILSNHKVYTATLTKPDGNKITIEDRDLEDINAAVDAELAKDKPGRQFSV